MDTDIPSEYDSPATVFLKSLSSKLNRNNNITKENNININDSKLLISDIQKKFKFYKLN